MRRPNILHVTWHDCGRFLGCHGRAPVSTPRVDALAAGGMRFTNYWSVSPVCSPARVAALTGRWPQRAGVYGLCHAPWNYGLAPEVPHLARRLAEAGWHSALIGWQHETTHERVGELGFHEIHLNDPLPPCSVVAPFAADWLRRRATQPRPFFLQLGFSEIHRPHDADGTPPDSPDQVWLPPWLADTPTHRRELAQQQGMIRRADAALGQVLDALREAGLERDTLVIFTGDHGVEMPRAKWTCYDAGLEIPLIIRWPAGGLAAGTTCDALLSNLDFTPTLLDWLGLPGADALDGASFAPALRGEIISGRDAVFSFFFADHSRAIRTATHKLIWHPEPVRWQPAPHGASDAAPALWPHVEFFDLRADPLESRNLSAIRPAAMRGRGATIPGEREATEVENYLLARLRAWLRATDDPILHRSADSPFAAESRAGLGLSRPVAEPTR